jgi:hypothetical protein
LPADGNSDGAVDNDDLDFWRSRFGNALSGGAAAATAVPEPGAAVLVFAGFALVLLRVRRLGMQQASA